MKKYIITAVLFIAFFWNNTSFLYAEEANPASEKSSTEEVKQLKLEWVEVLWKNKVELEFDSKIENSDKDISVRSVWDDSEEFFVSDYEVNEKKVLLILEDELESNKDYEIIIFSIMWEDGSTITSGLDWALKFTSPDLTIFDEKVKEVEMASAWVKEKIKEPKKVEVKKVEEKNDNLAWKDVKQEEVDKNIEVTASNTDELVKTWPEHVLLSILALILAALIWYTLNQRKNNKI
jgi:hypothetical protein